MKKLLIAMFAVLTAAVWAVPASEARIDFYNNGAGAGIKVADKGSAYSAGVQKWMVSPKRGGAVANFKFKGTEWQTLAITVQTVKDGRFEIVLRGPDVKQGGKRIPAKLEVSKLTVNGKVQYDGQGKFLTIWHDSPKAYAMPAKDGETFKVELTARPCAR